MFLARADLGLGVNVAVVAQRRCGGGVAERRGHVGEATTLVKQEARVGVPPVVWAGAAESVFPNAAPQVVQVEIPGKLVRHG